ncbi:RidA family protein [Undibacterium sp. Di24W]|uniref:RidA family protein n=1 Tax=Undibacterium sp. Di24W TaxID=3413033 RepID=UPI003BF3F3BE
MRQFITSGDGLPKWSTPISHAVVVDNICYLSGQLSIGEDGQYIAGTAREEAARAFANLFAAIKAANFSINDLTFVDIAFIDLNELGEVNDLYAELFPEGQRPARTIYQAAALPYGGRVKVMGVAIKERIV